MSKKIYHQFACSKMMLPEHRGNLETHNSQEAWKEKYRRPYLDEQRYDQFQQILEQALLLGQNIRLIIIVENGYKTITGVPLRNDCTNAIIFVDTGDRSPLPIAAGDIVSLEHLSE